DDDAHRIEERQAGLDAADDDVDRIRKVPEEFRVAALAQIGQNPERQPERGGEAERGRGERTSAAQEHENEDDRAEQARTDHELLLRKREARLADAHVERRVLDLPAARLEVLQRLL